MIHSPSKLKCFVASAFNRRDVAKFFDLAIKPALKEFNISARAVNRVEHNDNIDKKIIELIEQSDLMIADLTYARPSVYYEAGLAEKQMPVIYTARDDHFRQRDNDPNGNRCIHFDLTKKNIIPWNASTLSKAKKKLDRRIAYVARPLFLRLAKDHLEDARSNRFARLSPKKKLEHIYKRISTTLQRKKYVLEGVSEKESLVSAQYSRLFRNNILVINCHLMTSAPKKYFTSTRWIIDQFLRIPERYRTKKTESLKPKSAKRIIFVWVPISLRKITTNLLHEVFPTFDISQDPNHIFSTAQTNRHRLPVPYEIHFCAVDALQNELQFDQRVLSMVTSIESGCA